MKPTGNNLIYKGLTAAMLASLSLQSQADAPEEFSEFAPIVEINASDGDVGFHVLLDGAAWKKARIFDPDGNRIFKASDYQGLREQGLTELFMETAEPLCWHDTEDEDYDPDDVVTVADFVSRFPAGEYEARGKSIDNGALQSIAELTHNLPAAPETDISVELDSNDEDSDGDEYEVTISWEPGTDLGECEFTIGANEGEIPDPSTIEVVRWEVVVEPDDDTFLEETGLEEWPDNLPETKFSVQLHADTREIELPEEFIMPYVDAGMYYFKYEVGAKEEGGNQTFTEEEFSVGI